MCALGPLLAHFALNLTSVSYGRRRLIAKLKRTIYGVPAAHYDSTDHYFEEMSAKEQNEGSIKAADEGDKKNEVNFLFQLLLLIPKATMIYAKWQNWAHFLLAKSKPKKHS